MFISVDSGSLAANTFARLITLPSTVYPVTVSTPGSGGAAHMPAMADRRFTRSRSATASAMATFSLKVTDSNPAMSASLTESGSTTTSRQLRFAASRFRIGSRSRSAVTHTPPTGIDRDSDLATSSKVGPISARWSSRTLLSTPIVDRISLVWFTSCRSGMTAMHSITSTSGRYAAARRTIPICSTMLGIPNLR